MQKKITGPKKEFILSATVDFPDDVSASVFTISLLDELMAELQNIGVTRIYWIYYGESDPESYWAGDFYCNNPDKNALQHLGLRLSSVNLGNDLKAAVDSAHARGMELYAVFKPYHTGLSGTLPEGAEESNKSGLKRIGGRSWTVAPLIERHPYLLTRRYSSPQTDHPNSEAVRKIRLLKKDDSLTRIQKQDLQIWTSKNNYRYEMQNVDFNLKETVEPAHREVRDYYGETITKKGSPIRILTLEGLNLKDQFVLLTTGFRQGPSDFINTPERMIEAYGTNRDPMATEVASLSSVWHRPRDFKTGGLEYDSGFGTLQIALDSDNTPPIGSDGWQMMCRNGVVAFGRGKNEYLPTMACEMYPEMRKAWDGWVGFILDSGADGIDIRISSHGNMVDAPFEYGYNQPIVDEFRARHGCDPTDSLQDRQLIADIRGEYYTNYLRQLSKRVRNAGKALQFHLHTEAFRPNPTHGQIMGIPSNLNFEWRKWIAENLFDAATIRTSWFEAWEDPPGGDPYRQRLEKALGDPVAQEALDVCNRAGIPLYLNRYVARAVDENEYVADLEATFKDDRMSGFDLYESANLLRAKPDGSGFEHVENRTALIRNKSRELGII